MKHLFFFSLIYLQFNLRSQNVILSINKEKYIEDSLKCEFKVILDFKEKTKLYFNKKAIDCDDFFLYVIIYLDNIPVRCNILGSKSYMPKKHEYYSFKNRDKLELVYKYDFNDLISVSNLKNKKISLKVLYFNPFYNSSKGFIRNVVSNQIVL